MRKRMAAFGSDNKNRLKKMLFSKQKNKQI